MIRGEGRLSGLDLDVVDNGDSFDVYFHVDNNDLAMDDDTVEAKASPVMRLARQDGALVLVRHLNFGVPESTDGRIVTSFQAVDGAIALDEFEQEARRAIAVYRSEQ
jgi:hypothetical protein